RSCAAGASTGLTELCCRCVHWADGAVPQVRPLGLTELGCRCVHWADGAVLQVRPLG
ncbi:hypothetical protein LEMLEM_LOCUS10507, partial [Lemmus lemmus]